MTTISTDSLYSIVDWAHSFASGFVQTVTKPKEIPVPVIPAEVLNLQEMYRNSQGVIRVAGLCGAAAIALGAYGSHVIRSNPDISPNQRVAFETGNRYHLIHSVVLLAAPAFRHPKVSSVLFLSGICLFSGGCYHYALTGEDTVRKITPYGGVALILAWLSLIW